MHLQHPKDKILVATSMNFTADLVAEALYGIETLKDKICRVFSTTREDIFNVSISELPEWSIIYKMLFDQRKMDDAERRVQASFMESLLQGGDFVSDANVILGAKF